MFEVELLVLLLWRWSVDAMLFDVVVVVMPSVLSWCCCCVVMVSVLPSEKVIVLKHPMKIAPVIITRIYSKTNGDDIMGFDFS
jgi:hypothetical protein